MRTDLLVGRAAAEASFAREEMERRSRETMGEMVVQPVFMTAQAEAEALAQLGILLLSTMAGQVVLENQAASVARVPATAVVAAALVGNWPNQAALEAAVLAVTKAARMA